MQGNDSRAEQVLIQALALRVGLSEWFRFVRLSLPAIFILAIYYLDLQFDLFGIIKAILVFLGLEIISEAPDLLSKVRPKTKSVLTIGYDLIDLNLENNHRLPMDGLISLQAETHWWPLKRNTIRFEYPEGTRTIRTNLHYAPLFRRLRQLGDELGR
ncbi:hypothetical protein CK501_04745 [Halovibrio salipaludis]|uniref:Uncharacterized protein n=1 Tax=Halovibrio salipaludis TaxID=2032626 RepID=A0A2A2FAC8_9GAMM|nr:hypothetical protein [Halovibrio salipaludis]PAU82451.1 hypothetical protein CK501_04745 [Halovibrio salipaludis]